MEQVTVTVYADREVVYDQVTAWIQVNHPISWGGHLIAAEGHELYSTSGLGLGRLPFSLRTVDGRGGVIFITSANTQTREVHFVGSGPLGLVQ
jgi:hypothetical protein